MEKVLGIVVAATVLLVAAVTVIALTSTSFGEFQEEGDRLGDSACDFQIEQSTDEDGEIDCTRVDADCTDDCTSEQVSSASANYWEDGR